VVSRRCARCKFRVVGTVGKSVPGGSINGAIVIVAYRELWGTKRAAPLKTRPRANSVRLSARASK